MNSPNSSKSWKGPSHLPLPKGFHICIRIWHCVNGNTSLSWRSANSDGAMQRLQKAAPRAASYFTYLSPISTIQGAHETKHSIITKHLIGKELRGHRYHHKLRVCLIHTAQGSRHNTGCILRTLDYDPEAS